MSGAAIDHVNLVVADLERAAAFYGTVLGLRRGFRRMLEGNWLEHVTGLAGARAECLFLEPPAGGTRLELLEYHTPRGETLSSNRLPHTPGIRHVAFTLESAAALDEAVRRAREAGAEVVSEPVAVPFVVGALGRKRLCYLRDPEGVLVELAAYVSEATPSQSAVPTVE